MTVARNLSLLAPKVTSTGTVDNSGLTNSAITINGTAVSLGGTATVSAGASALTIDNKTAAYTVVAGDLGKIINCTSGTFTVSLTAAATLGAGFNCWIWNTGTGGAITIDPDGAETIAGNATLILRQNEGTQIVSLGTSWQTGDKKAMKAFSENTTATFNRASAVGDSSVAIGPGAVTNANDSIAFGLNATVSTNGASGIALGRNSAANNSYTFAAFGTASGSDAIAVGTGTVASGNYSTAIGKTSGSSGSQAITGAGAMALGGSYASGTDSFAAITANNTSTYGATGANSIAFGYLAKASVTNALALGYLSSATASTTIAIGVNTTASATASTALGNGAQSLQYGKLAYEGYSGFGNGASQFGLIIYVGGTTDGTAKVLTANNGAASSTNLAILPNNSAYAFSGIIVARQQAAGGTQTAAWEVKGLIRREGTAGSTVLVNSALTVINNAPGWTLALSADTTNGGLAITATGAAATNIRWVATIQTSEVTYA